MANHEIAASLVGKTNAAEDKVYACLLHTAISVVRRLHVLMADMTTALQQQDNLF